MIQETDRRIISRQIPDRITTLQRVPEYQPNSREQFYMVGPGNTPLAEKVIKILGGQPQNPVTRWGDGEARVKIDKPVRGGDVFIFQSMQPDPDRRILETRFMIDAATRASAASITLVIPYLGYARSERKNEARVGILSRVVSDILVNEPEKVDRAITMNIHAGAIQGQVNKPWDDISMEGIYEDMIRAYMEAGIWDNVVLGSPDFGAAKKNKNYIKNLKLRHVTVDKVREEKGARAYDFYGDARGQRILWIDDLIASGGTSVEAADKGEEAGADSSIFIVTHGIFSGKAVENIHSNKNIEAVYVSDSIEPNESVKEYLKDADCKINYVTAAPLIARAIRSVQNNASMSNLFNSEYQSGDIYRRVLPQ